MTLFPAHQSLPPHRPHSFMTAKQKRWTGNKHQRALIKGSWKQDQKMHHVYERDYNLIVKCWYVCVFLISLSLWGQNSVLTIFILKILGEDLYACCTDK